MPYKKQKVKERHYSKFKHQEKKLFLKDVRENDKIKNIQHMDKRSLSRKFQENRLKIENTQQKKYYSKPEKFNPE